MSGPLLVSRDISEEEWNGYIAAHPLATADHLWGWRKVFASAFGQSSEYLAARRNGSIVGVLPLVLFRSRLFGRSVISVPYLNYGGLLADDTSAAAALVDQATDVARRFRATHLELRHVERQLPELPVKQHKLGLTLRLQTDSDSLWKQIDRKVRNQVRKAQKEGLSAEHGGLSLVENFYTVFAENMRDLGTPVYSRRLFLDTVRQFPDRATVFLVKRGGRPIAGSIAIRFRDVVLVPWASSLREFRHLCPNMLLYWTMLEQATNTGAAVFDFGRSSPGGGTHQFKLQWGATETPLHWEYVMLNGSDPPNQGPSNPKFAAAIELWKKLPLWVTKSCGPHLARHLP